MASQSGLDTETTAMAPAIPAEPDCASRARGEGAAAKPRAHRVAIMPRPEWLMRQQGKPTEMRVGDLDQAVAEDAGQHW
jgi:hypothetical protein